LLSLPSVHRDPFDRALIAQAMVEGLALLTTDSIIPRYATFAFRVIA
jgi:PIN domain nuclease of toxin-antitoxin system